MAMIVPVLISERNLRMKSLLFKIDPRVLYLLLVLSALAAAAGAPFGACGYTMP